MIIVDPVTLGDVACTRASPKWAFDRAGTLAQVPANTLAVTYDPSDLSKAPYALIELAPSTNLWTWSNDLTQASWSPAYVSVQSAARANAFGANVNRMTPDSSAGLHFLGRNSVPALTAGLPYSVTFVLASNNLRAAVEFFDGGAYRYVTADVAAGTLVSVDGALTAKLTGPDTFGFYILTVTGTVASAVGTPRFTLFAADASGLNFSGNGTLFLDVAFAQLEQGPPTSLMPTTGTTTTRAADVIAPGAGLVFSNVPIAEAPYSAGTTYAKDALAYDPATHNVFQSLTAGNVGKALTDTTAWTPRGATNRWAMLDQYNNTQTTNADEILMVVSPQAISQGLYLGNMYADEVRVSVVDQVEGLVYSETSALIESNSGSSFFNWCFKRIKRRDYFLTLKLPAYANALVTISLRKIGSTAKCGMCMIGPIDEYGPTLMGLSTEGKDYSSTTFNFDGTSSTVIRPYAKRMNCDVMVDNDQIDYLQARLFEIRQKPVVWVGGPYGSTAVVGRYESFKNVIQYATYSLMNLTIGGAV